MTKVLQKPQRREKRMNQTKEKKLTKVERRASTALVSLRRQRVSEVSVHFFFHPCMNFPLFLGHLSPWRAAEKLKNNFFVTITGPEALSSMTANATTAAAATAAAAAAVVVAFVARETAAG